MIAAGQRRDTRWTGPGQQRLPGLPGQDQRIGRAIAAIHSATQGDAAIAARFATDDLFAALRIEPYLLHTARAHPDLAAIIEGIAATTQATRAALVHGDVSPKNILCGRAGPVLIDAECAWYGDPAFDLAFCATHLLLKGVWHPQWEPQTAAAFDALHGAYLDSITPALRDGIEARAIALLAAILLARIDGLTYPQIAAELGITTAALSQTIRIATLGEIEQNAARFSLSDRQIPIVVRLSEEARSDFRTIENLPVPLANGGSVPLSRVAEITFGSGPTAIQRYNQNRRVLVGADLAAGVLKGEAQAQIDALPVLQDLPLGVIRDVVGEEEWQAELIQNLIIAIISGVLLVFAVLVLLYKRLMSPLVNMTSLALAPLGGVLLIWLFGQAQSMPVYIGILLLLGIVSKNSILLIDFAIEEMAKGVGKLDAIMDAGHKRAQPIVMTTVAMTAGMVPVALSLSGDSAWRQPMGVVVIGGLVVSTLLTLLIVPAGFSLADGLEKRVGPWLRARMLTYKPGDENAAAPTVPDRPFPGLAKLTPPDGEPAE